MTGWLKISRIGFTNGPSKNSSPLNVDVKNIMVLVGPNDSGKSTAIKNIESWKPLLGQAQQIISDIDLIQPQSDDDFSDLFDVLKSDQRVKERGQGKYSFVTPSVGQTPPGEFPFDRKRLQLFFQALPTRKKGNNTADLMADLTELLKKFTIKLDARTRFSIMDSIDTGDLKEHPINYLASLFHRKQDLREVNDVIHEQFDVYLYLDPFNRGQFTIRMNPKLIEHAVLDDDYLEFLRKSETVTSYGDGVQAFVSLYLAVRSFSERIILIDEPEAFLHPPQAHDLARVLTSAAIKRDATLILSTHSSEILLGCLEETSEITIVRLTHKRHPLGTHEGTATALDYKDVNKFREDALLRATQTLNALFYNGAVVTEADADRVFYSEINHRIPPVVKGANLDVLFQNALGKQTIHEIVSLLRKIGVPAAAIYDLDFIKLENNASWENILFSARIETSLKRNLSDERAWLENEFRTISIDKDFIKENGIKVLPSSSKNRAEKFLKMFENYGIFVVPVGELERWLSFLNITASKRNWLPAALRALDTANIQSYRDDVWEFVAKINKWIANADRAGML